MSVDCLNTLENGEYQPIKFALSNSPPTHTGAGHQ